MSFPERREPCQGEPRVDRVAHTPPHRIRALNSYPAARIISATAGQSDRRRGTLGVPKANGIVSDHVPAGTMPGGSR
jgi:hypothetical protein